MTFFLVFCATILLDQLSKGLVLSLMQYGQSIPLLGSWFSLTLTSNQGAAFGLFPQAGLFFLVFRLVVVALPFLFWTWLRRQPFWFQFACGMICGGALGNVIDQVMYGAVVDFLHPSFWSVFNLADSAVVVGAVLLALTLLWTGKKASQGQPS